MRSAGLVSPHADPWAAEVVDLEALNSAATDAIVAAVNDVRERARKHQGTRGPSALVAVGPAGVGKTHLFGRLRRKLGPKAVLVHVRPLVGAEMTPRFLLGQIVQQLGYESYGLRQIDVVAGVALAIAGGENGKYPAACLTELRELDDRERANRIEQAVSTLTEQHPEIDSGYLERLFYVPFTEKLVRQASLVWLSGRELDDAQQRRAGVREALPDSVVIPALRTLAIVSSLAAPLLIVFDQLENLVEADGSAGRVVAYGNLVAELVDSVRDLVIVQMGLSSEWEQHIVPRLGASHLSRIGGRQIPLALPDAEQKRALLELWIGKIPDPDAAFPWPLSRPQLDALCAMQGLTPRMLLLDLKTALDGGELALAHAPVKEPSEAIAAAWQALLETQRRHIDEMATTGHGPEPAYLLDGLVSLGAMAGAIGPIKAEKELLASQRGRIALVHQANNASVRSVLRKLATVGDVLAIRERWREWPPTWKTTRADWDTFRKRAGVRWHWLDREDAARLLALAALLKDARSSDVEDASGTPIPLESVESWVKGELRPEQWAVSRALLGEMPSEEPSAGTPKTGTAGAAADVLRALRVASLEHVIRACDGASRSVVQAELHGNPKVKWIGDAIVCWAE